MTTSQLIAYQLEQLTSLSVRVTGLRERFGTNPKSDLAIHKDFVSLMRDFPAHPMVMKAFSDFLQLIDDKSSVGSYELEELRSLFQALVSANPQDVEALMESLYFEDAVMGDLGEAREIELKVKELTSQTLNQIEGWKRSTPEF